MSGLIFGLIGWILAACASAPPAPPARLAYPPARTDDTVETIQGVVVADPYRWMENHESEETRRWIQEEEALFQSFVGSVPERETYRRRILELSSQTLFLAPMKAGGRYFLTRISSTGVPAGLYVQDTPEATPRPLLDPKSLGARTTLGAAVPSPDGRYVAYTTASGQSRWLRIRLLDAKTGEDVPVPSLSTHAVAGLPVWARDSRALYFIRFEPRSGASEDTAPPDRPAVRRYRLAERRESAVYEPPADPGLLVGLAAADEGGELVVSLQRGSENRHRVFLVDPERRREPVALMPVADANYAYLGSRGNRFWFFTDRDAPRGRVIALERNRPQPENWKEVVPQASDPVAASSAVGGNAIGMFANRILLVYVRDGRPILRVFDAGGRLRAEPGLPTGGQIWGGFSGSPDDPRVFYRFLGLTHASTTYRLDLETNEVSIFSSSESAGRDRDISVEQVFYRSTDGTRVPMFLAHRKDFRRDGRGPAFMYGYGAFGWVSFLWYQPFVLNWLQLGGVYALPGIRGGGEYGEDWHRAGAGRSKQKAIDDYLAAAEWLVANGYSSSSRLVANGGSASGGVAAAAVLQRPELFGAAVIDRPVLDMLRFDRFSQAAYWLPEFGSPRDPEDFAALRAWSPYHNVKKGGCYPPMLVMAGERDQVAVPLHAYKFVAALQAAQGCANPALLQVVRGAGHNFGTTPEQTAETWADETAFLTRVLGIPPPGK
jgi:prolyl oligopeptidase